MYAAWLEALRKEHGADRVVEVVTEAISRKSSGTPFFHEVEALVTD